MAIKWINTPTTLLVALKGFIVAVTFLENVLNSNCTMLIYVPIKFEKFEIYRVGKDQGLVKNLRWIVFEYLKQIRLFKKIQTNEFSD